MATEVVNVPDLDLQFFGNDGKPMASGHVVFFRNGTDIPESVYTSDGETSLGNSIELDASGFPVVQFSLIADKKYTVKLFDSDNVLVWTRNDIQGTICGGPGPIGDFIPMDGTTPADPVRGPLIMSYDGKTAILNGEYLSLTSGGKTTTLTTEYLSNDSAMQMVAPTVTMGANNGGAYVFGTPRVSINANGPDSALINIQSDKKIEMQGTQIEIKAPNSGNEITINSKGITEIIGGLTSVQGNNGLSLYGGGTGITINGAANFLSTATLNNKTVSDIWTSSSTGTPLDSQLITAKAALEAGGGGMTNPMTDEGDMIVGGVDGAPTRLANGIRGQLLTMGASGPEWSNKPAACQENYSIIDSTGVYAADSYKNQILTSKVIANVDRTYSQLGFGLKKGQTGGTGRFMLAIYDVGKNLVASTPLFQITETYQGEVYWVNTEDTFKLDAGEEYFFAFWCEEYPASNLIQFLGHQQVSTFDADLVGILYGQSGLSEMPLSLGTLSYGQMCPYMAVR